MARRKILAVDDAKVFLDLLENYLQRIGGMVTRAASADEAWKLARAGTYDLVISDLDMPGRQGDALCRQIKEWNPHLKVVLLVNRRDEKLEQACLQSGCDAVLAKPIQEEELVQLTSRLLDLDLRRKVRMPVDLQAEIGDQGMIFSGISVNMSNGGVFLRTTQKLSYGQLLRLRLRMAGGDLHLQGRVVRHTYDSASGLHGVGIEFVDIDPLSVQIIDSFLRNCAVGS